jgi:hypothetical protein
MAQHQASTGVEGSRNELTPIGGQSGRGDEDVARLDLSAIRHEAKPSYQPQAFQAFETIGPLPSKNGDQAWSIYLHGRGLLSPLTVAGFMAISS